MGKIVKARGPVPAELALVGEAPGKEEVAFGWSFVGSAGKEQSMYLFKAGLNESEIYITNLVKQAPTGKKGLTQDEIARDAPILDAELCTVRPRVVGTVGAFSTRRFLGDVDMEAVHGKAFDVTRPHAVSRRFPSVEVVVPLYHPAAPLYAPELGGACAWDYRQLARVLKGEVAPERWVDDLIDTEYVDLSEEEGEIPDLTNEMVYIDTEGDRYNPYCLTFSTKPGTGYLIRADDTRRLKKFWRKLATAANVTFHNAMYDLDVCMAMGGVIEEYDDTMVKAYNLGGLEPQGLKALCFRNEKMRMQDYNDLTWGQRNLGAVDYLKKALVAAKDLPKPDKVMDVVNGKPKVRQPQHATTRIVSILSSWKKDPDEIDVRKKWGEMDEVVRGPVDELAGGMPPFTLDEIDPEEVTYYACRDADGTGRVDAHLDALLNQYDTRKTYLMDMGALPMAADFQRNGMYANQAHYEKLKKRFEKERDYLQVKLTQHNGGNFLNTNSGDQVADLLFNRLKLRTKFKTESGERYSTNDKVLQAIKTSHPVVELIVRDRELEKLRQFCDMVLEAARREKDSRVRGAVRVTRVTTGRFSMTDPNMMAIPVHSDDGNEIRRGFEAPDGWAMWGIDLNQVEMRYMASESKDKLLIKRFLAGADVHRDTASDIFGVKPEMVVKSQRESAKRAGFGIITGITEVGMLDQLESFGITDYTLDDCKRIISEWLKLYSGVSDYIQACRQEAKRYGYVKDRWGRIRFLPGIHSELYRVRGESERASHSQKIQGGAQGVLKRAMARTYRDSYIRSRSRFLLQIHDELIGESKKEDAAEIAGLVAAHMEADSHMFPVPFTTSIHIGANWAELK